jgi:NitT/TauT family transport system substrate-binding protein
MSRRLLPAGALGALALLAAVTASAADPAQVRVGVLQFGTVAWELDVMQAHGLAAREGVEVRVTPLASTSATTVALQGGAVDLIVTDWLWVSRQRAQGRSYTFVPYSLTVGGLMVRPDAGIRGLGDLRGKRVGVAGGPVDKSWLLLRAYGRRTLGEDLTKLVEPSYGAPPLLNELVSRGELAAVLNYWQYSARLKAAGLHELLTVAEVLRGLGIPEPTPLLGWVFDERWAGANRKTVTGFLRAAYAAKGLLRTSDAEWERIRPLLGATDPAVVRALRDGFRDGIPRRFGPAELEAAGRVVDLLVQEGGEDLVGPQRRLSPGTFWEGFSIPP